MTMTDTPVDNTGSWRLECVGLSVRRGRHLAVSDVNLVLDDGDEGVSLIGPNGSGKTTLMLAWLGLLAPSQGVVRLNGRDLRQYAARARGRFAAYVPQVIDQVPPFRVYDVVASGRFAWLGPLRPRSTPDHEAVHSALQRCGLAELAQRPVNAISGGELRKTLIAAAIAQDPRVMFLDEPNTALDPAYQVELVRILQQWRRRGRGVVLISHDLQLPAALGGRVIALQAGRVVADGTAAEVLSPEMLSTIYSARFATATTPDGPSVVLPAWWDAD